MGPPTGGFFFPPYSRLRDGNSFLMSHAPPSLPLSTPVFILVLFIGLQTIPVHPTDLHSLSLGWSGLGAVLGTGGPKVPSIFVQSKTPTVNLVTEPDLSGFPRAARAAQPRSPSSPWAESSLFGAPQSFGFQPVLFKIWGLIYCVLSSKSLGKSLSPSVCS